MEQDLNTNSEEKIITTNSCKLCFSCFNKKNKNNYLKNDILNPLLTDFYQLTMVYAYWKVNRHNEKASFDLFFRKNPFKSNVHLSFIYNIYI